MALALGLAVALTYGTADFLGGLATRSNRAFVVVALSQAWGVVVLAVAMALAPGDVAPTSGDLVLGGAVGVVGLLGVTLLYRALASGAMAVVAPVTAVGAAVLPVGWGLAGGERPSQVALVGAAAALVAVVLVAGGGAPSAVPVASAGAPGGAFRAVVDPGTASPGSRAVRAGRDALGLAAAAGAAFGVLFILLSATTPASGLSPLVAARVVSLAMLGATAALTRQALVLTPGTATTVAGAGLLDMGANVLFVLAARRGLLSLVAVLASLYPAATTLLARIVLGERLRPLQLVGLALALVGLALIAAG